MWRARTLPSVPGMGRRDEDEGISPRARARLRGRAPVAGGSAPAEGPPRAGRVGYVPRPEDLVAHVRAAASGGERGGAVAGGGPTPGGPRGRHRRAPLPGRGWVRLPASFVGALWQPGRAGVLGVAAVAVLAVLVFGVRVAWARSAGEPVVVAPGGGARAGPEGVSAGAAPVGLASSTGSPAPSGGASPTDVGAGAGVGDGGVGGASAVVVVHVVGEVRRPGLQRLPPGSRVSDAVEAAGGPTRTADLGAVNLARPVVDGEQVRVPAPGEVVHVGGVPGGAAPGVGAAPGGAAAGGTVSLNTADPATLETLPGVGPVLAQRIVEWRTAHGGFTSVDELTEVSGIGEKTFEQLRPLVTP